MRIDIRREVILDARQPLDWVHQVLDELQNCRLKCAEEPTRIVVTEEQLADLIKRCQEKYAKNQEGGLYGRPPSPTALWGIPVEVER